MKPLVSVLVPCYNCEEYIVQAIESLIEQSYTNLEIMVCDDGSQDCSYQLLFNLSAMDKRVKLYKNEKNIGKVKTINQLLSVSSGEFIAFLDADDFVAQKKIERQVEFMLCNTSHVLCGTQYIRVDQKGKRVEEVALAAKDHQIREEVLGATGMPVCCGSVLICGDIARRVGGYRSYFHDCSGEDVDFIARVLDYGKGENLPYRDYYYRYRPNSLTRRVHTTVKQRHSHEIIAMLAKERWSTDQHKDSVDFNSSGLLLFLGQLSEPYIKDSHLMGRKKAYDFALNSDFRSSYRELIAAYSFRGLLRWFKCFFIVNAILLLPNSFLLHVKSALRVKNLSKNI